MPMATQAIGALPTLVCKAFWLRKPPLCGTLHTDCKQGYCLCAKIETFFIPGTVATWGGDV